MSKHIKDGRAFLFLQKFCKLYMEDYNKFAIIESEYAHDAEIQTLVCVCVTAKERRGDFYVVSSMRTLFLNNESLIYVSSSCTSL